MSDANETVLVIPGRPRPWKRPGNARQGRFDASADEKHEIAQIARIEHQGAPWICPVKIEISFHFRRPKRGHDQEVYFTGTPDFDNLKKLVCDACNKIVYEDDRQICLWGFGGKFYNPVAEMTIVRFSKVDPYVLEPSPNEKLMQKIEELQETIQELKDDLQLERARDGYYRRKVYR